MRSAQSVYVCKCKFRTLTYSNVFIRRIKMKISKWASICRGYSIRRIRFFSESCLLFEEKICQLNNNYNVKPDRRIISLTIQYEKEVYLRRHWLRLNRTKQINGQTNTSQSHAAKKWLNAMTNVLHAVTLHVFFFCKSLMIWIQCALNLTNCTNESFRKALFFPNF